MLGIAIGSFSPEWLVAGLATFSGLFGNFLGFAIPLIIIGFIAPGIGELGRGAGRLLGVTTGLAYLSTIIAGLLAFLARRYCIRICWRLAGWLIPTPIRKRRAGTLFKVDMPPVFGVMTALLLAFTLGLGAAVIKGQALQKVMVDFREIVEKLIASIIIPRAISYPLRVC